MKRILFYIDSMQIGGANRVIANLVEYFFKLGKEVILVNDIKLENNILEYEIPKKVIRKYLDDKLRGRLKKNILRIIRLRRIIKEEKPDVVLSFMGPPNERMILATLGLPIRKIVSVRNDPYREYGSGIKKIITNFLFRFVDGCVFQTEEAREYFKKTIQKKSTIIFNPVNKKFYNQELLQEKKYILMVGRLQSQKNPHLLLEAFLEIEDKYRDFKLIFCGEGELKESLNKKIVEKDLQERVIFCGQVKNVEKYLAEASVYVLSSDYEGMPNALMEAMAVGVPIIATDCPCGGPRTLIENEKQGILINCRDKESLQENLQKLLDDKDLRERMRSESRKRAEIFCSDKIFKQWEEFLN